MPRLKLVPTQESAPAQTTVRADRPHALLFDCCRCGPGKFMVCATCRRWACHQGMVTKRRRAWEVQP